MSSWLSRAAFVFALTPLLPFACTSSNLGTPSAGANPAACPATNPDSQSTCYSIEDGGTFSCNYACAAGSTGSINVTCDGTQWQETSNTCAVPVVAATGPISCGDRTCSAGEYCVHECCDITPCTEPTEDGGCQAGSHATTNDCSGGCIENDPECSPSDSCQSAVPDDCIAEKTGYCASGCSD